MTEAPRLAALIRHGAYHQRAGAPSALQPFALSDQGLAQARACGDQIAGMIAAHGARLVPQIWCSPQLRAWQTADQIALRLRALGHAVAPPRETPALSERAVGSVANLTVAEIEAVMAADPRMAPPPPGWKSDSHYCLPFPGAESLMDAGARVSAHLRQHILAAQPGSLTLFVGHGASFRHGAHHLGVLNFDQISKLSMHHARAVLIGKMPRGGWEHIDGDWKIRPPSKEPMD